MAQQLAAGFAAAVSVRGKTRPEGRAAVGYKIKGGKLQRSVKLHPKAMQALMDQREAFI